MIDFAILSHLGIIQNKIVKGVEEAKEDDGKVSALELTKIVLSIIPEIIEVFAPMIK